MQPNLEKYTLMKKILSIITFCMLSMSMFAVIASPEPIEVTQPDGSTLTVKLVGDEFHSYYTTLDGTPLRRTASGKFVQDASVVEMPSQARKARQVAQKLNYDQNFPLSGSPRSVVILVNFADVKFKYTKEDFEKMLNTPGYKENNGVGSARDYFIGCSDSAFAPIFDCYGPVTLSKKREYYGSNKGGNNSAHADRMVVEACNLVEESGVDFSQYDTNNDGRLDNVFIYYAGHNEAEGADANTIWPHRFIVSTGEQVSGKTIYDYACTSELRGNAGTAMCGIGTFCHEFGHVLGLPDYYDTDDKDANRYTIGNWDIMCSGSYNGNGKTPPTYTAGERFQLGWLKPIQLKEAGPYTLEPLATSNTAYLIANTTHDLKWPSSPNEYWLLENRQHVGWDTPSSALPGTGLIIWHINYNATAWATNSPNNGTPLRYDLEEAGGQKGYSSNSDPFPGNYKVTQFTPIMHDGTMVEQPLLDIAQDGKNIVFTFKSSEQFFFLPSPMPTIESTYNTDTKKAYTPAYAMKVIGNQLEPGSVATLSISGSGFALSLDSINWRTSLEVTVGADSTLEVPYYVHYAPRKQVCDMQRGTITIRHAAAVGTQTVLGTSPRPILIDAPQISVIKEVTPTSFKVKWIPEQDAEEYYITLYHMEEGEESTMESFEEFDNETAIQEAGWKSTFFRTTTKAKSDGFKSVWFKAEGEYLVTPIYPLPASNISFWLSAPATTDTEVGSIILSGWDKEGNKIALDTIAIKKSTKQYTYSLDIDESKQLYQFEIKYASFGGEGVCMDAFTTTFDQQIVYTYKGREKTIAAQEGDIAEDYAIFYAYDLIPGTDYYLQIQCSENKGCSENLSALSKAQLIRTPQGEASDSERLTLAYDSIYYTPGTHVIYIPQSLQNGSIGIYTATGELVDMIPVSATSNIVPLPTYKMQCDAVYLIKYLPIDKMGRKAPWIKIIFK